MLSYTILKHLHVTAAVVSLVFFVVRAYWSVMRSPKLQARFVRIAPHAVDTILLLSGLSLAFTIGFHQTWILAKIIGVVLYIAVGFVAIRKGKTATTRALAAVVAVLIFFYIIGVALTHNPLSWWS
jgi:uncharacterized membrane protein SirB2